MKKADAFPSRYLSQADVITPIQAKISDVCFEEIKGEKGTEEKAVMHFQGPTKPLVLNGVNWSMCESAYGQESDDWKGCLVEIYTDPTVMFGPKRVGGLRLRIPLTSGIAPNPPIPVWTLDQAVQACEAAGITRQELIEEVKSRGFAGWNAARDTPAIQAMIAKKTTTEQAFDARGEDIPF